MLSQPPVLSQAVKRPGNNFDHSPLYLTPRSRINEPIALLPTYAFIACTVAILPLFYFTNLTATSFRPFRGIQFRKLYLIEAAKIMCAEKVQGFKNVYFSANRVAECTSNMANKLRYRLRSNNKTVHAYSRAVGESRDVNYS